MTVTYIPTASKIENNFHIGQITRRLRSGELHEPEENVIVYAGWPQVKDYNGRTHISDLTVMGSDHGIKMIKFSNSENLTDLKKDALSIMQAAATTESLLGKSLDLKRKRRLIFDVVPVLFAPNASGADIGTEEVEVAETEAELIRILSEADSSLTPAQQAEVQAIVEGAKALGQITETENDGDIDPIARAFFDLESIIYNFDATQRAVALTSVNGPQRIRGLAGTGKTVILAMKAALTHIENPNGKILITYYTRSLRDVIERLITRFHRHFAETDPNWDNIHVRHGWGRSNLPGVYRDTCIREGKSPRSFADVRGQKDPFGAVCQEIVDSQIISEFYDVILIDEGQDFPDSFYQMCFYLAKGTRDEKQIIWAYDELQNVFDVQVREPELLFGTDRDGNPRISLVRSLPAGTDTNDFVLQRSYRNQRDVLVLAHSIGFGVYSNTVQMLENAKHWEDVGYEVVSGTFETASVNVVERPVRNSPSILHSPAEVPIVSTHPATDFDQEVEFAAAEVKFFINHGIAPHQIMIISLDDRVARSYFRHISDSLISEGIACNNIIKDTYSEPPFRIDGMVTMSTVYRAKGNEAAVVIVVGADAATLSTRNGRNKLFVALTRSKAWLRVMGVKSKVFAQIQQEFKLALDNSPRITFTMPDMTTLNTIQRGLEEKHARIIEAKRRMDKIKSELKLSDDDLNSLIEE
ncbi:DEAD/DEAH box helicase [Falsirhodobacter sp. alg1]|uniref:DEAD/DEAH box helicase n=1 Tax=Falsirhodobacter sp. alg1 TaxID=1472418 RepID=UPI0007885703|nr:ATP-binding domain-containing protein [Falsirhodobacter sp. alg1]